MQHLISNKIPLDVRKINILRSSKINGSSMKDSEPYLKELGIEIIEKKQPIQFFTNSNEIIHRWSPYVQGFSAYFVQSIIDSYKKQFIKPVILDPFAGCGTVLVQAKLNGITSLGIELNPLMHFISDLKLNTWDVSHKELIKAYEKLSFTVREPAPRFLHSEKHFNTTILRNLELIKGAIYSLPENDDQKRKIKNLLKLAFVSILIDCSNLKRTPCLGYSKNKKIENDAPFTIFRQKIYNIADDLNLIRSSLEKLNKITSRVIHANSMTYEHNDFFDIVITSPPYMNGMDYVINYKIEMGWLDFVDNNKKLKKVKDEMVVCDNVSKGLIKNFKENPAYTNEWIEKIKHDIAKNIHKRGKYRRLDMPIVVHKYFDDMYRIMKNTIAKLNKGGKFILVVGDSLIADVYIPTDLLIARIGSELGLNIEKVEKARDRRSGQIRTYKLRESIITLFKT